MEEKEVVMEQEKGFCGKVCDVLTSDTAKKVYKYTAIAGVIVAAGIGGLLLGPLCGKSDDTKTADTPPRVDEAGLPLCSIE